MIITNARIITWDQKSPLLQEKDIKIDQDQISDIRNRGELVKNHPDELIIDAQNKILMPGFICAHTHFYGLFSRGLAIPGNPPQNFTEILQKLWWPLDASLEAEDIKYCSLVCMIDAIKHGTTTLLDHHASPLIIEGSLDLIENVFRNAGVRGSVCYEVTDRYGVESRNLAINENVRMIRKSQRVIDEKDLVKPLFGVHASLTVSDQTLETIRENLPDGAGIHIHVAEDISDEKDSLLKAKLRVVNRLDKHNLISGNSLLVHGVHLDRSEMDLIKDSKSWISHQPRSNMNNAVGMAEIEKMDQMGIKVCLGNDGFSNTMLEEWRACYLAHKGWQRNPQAMNGNLVVKIGALNNGLLVSHLFNQKIGKISAGYKADLILVDYSPITDLNENNIPWHILFGFRDSMVTHTMVAGKWLMIDRCLINIDEDEVNSKALELSRGVWKRYSDKF